MHVTTICSQALLVYCILWSLPTFITPYIVEWDTEGLSYLTKRRRIEGPILEHNQHIGKLLDEYMIVGMPEVIGWLELQALLVVRVISSHQIENDVRGGVAEIGVHHGKFFAALSLVNMDAGPKSGVAIAIDVFEVTSAYLFRICVGPRLL